MTNCVRCGRPISDSSYAATSNLCPECRQAFAGAARPVPAGPPPVATTRPAPYRPPVTVAIVGINILVFAAMIVSGVSSMNPTEAQLLRFGADFGRLRKLALCSPKNNVDECSGDFSPTTGPVSELTTTRPESYWWLSATLRLDAS